MAVKVATVNRYLSTLCRRIFSSVQIGIIGGTGLDDPDILQDREEIVVDTPYGKVLIVYS